MEEMDQITMPLRAWADELRQVGGGRHESYCIQQRLPSEMLAELWLPDVAGCAEIAAGARIASLWWSNGGTNGGAGSLVAVHDPFPPLLLLLIVAVESGGLALLRLLLPRLGNEQRLGVLEHQRLVLGGAARGVDSRS